MVTHIIPYEDSMNPKEWNVTSEVKKEQRSAKV